MLPTKKDNPKGLYNKYYVQKIVYHPLNGMPAYKDVDEEAEYFVFRLDTGGSDLKHIAACRVGIHAYADAIEGHLPLLAKDLRERYPLLQPINLK